MQQPNKANKNLLGYIGNIPGTIVRDSDSWYTPQKYIEAARHVLGFIDLDPFSSEEANQQIQAQTIFTIDNSAFDHSWKAQTVWMNPPYSRGLATLCVEKFLSELTQKNFKSGIVLMNSSTDTKWFHKLLNHSSALCFTNGRIAFISGKDDKHVSGNTKGQVFFYFGTDTAAFMGIFNTFGTVLKTKCN